MQNGNDIRENCFRQLSIANGSRRLLSKKFQTPKKLEELSRN